MRRKTDSKRDLQDVLTNASPKQKAVLVCLHGKDAPEGDIALTAEDETAIERSLIDHREKAEYLKWICYYNVYVETAPMCGLATNTFKYSVMEAFAYVSLWEQWQNEETFVNALLKDIGEKAPSAADVIREYTKFLAPTQKFYRDFYKLHTDKEGFVQIDTNIIYKKIKEKIASVYDNYAVLKAFVIAQEEWTRKHRCAAIMPPVLKKTLDVAKADWHIIAGPKYSKKWLETREENGEKISLAERKRAVFPCYEEIKVVDEYVEVWREKIKEKEDAARKR